MIRDNTSTLIVFQRLLDPILAISLLSALTKYYNVYYVIPYILLGAIAFLLILPIFKATGLYHFYRGESLTTEIPHILLGWGIVLSILLFLGYITKSSAMFSRMILVAWAVSVPLALYVAHLSIRIVLRQLRATGRNNRTAVIAGVSEVGCQLAEQIQQDPYLGIKLSGFFDDRASLNLSNLQGKPLIGTLAELPEYVRQHAIDIVYITTSVWHEETLATLMEELQDTTTCVHIVPNIFMLNLMQAKFREINGIPLIAVWEVPFSDLQYILKRAIDIIFATLVLVLLSPLMVLIAIGVKCSSPGPVFFKQHRYGLNGQKILIYKFRSMTVMENGHTVIQAKRNDLRTTKFGAFLRRTSLDELPQFINVLQNRMSIVGPRPHAISHNEQYRKLIRGYMLRHKVKPGITGWAQIHGLRGETDTLDKMKKRVDYDLQYLKIWSLRLDLLIILRTFVVLFQNHNAF